MKFKDYLAFIFVASFLIVSVDLVLDYSGHHLLSRLTGYHFELVKTEDNAKPKTSSASQKEIIEYQLPDEAIGSGEFNISSASGSTESGQAVYIYKDGNWLQIGVSARNLDGALLTYFYIDGIEVDSKQVGLGMDGSLYVPDTKTNVGKHKVHAVQYKDNDKAKGLVFNRVHEFEIKEK